MEYVSIVLGAIMGILAIYKYKFKLKKTCYNSIIIGLILAIASVGIIQIHRKKEEIKKCLTEITNKTKIEKKQCDAMISAACIKCYDAAFTYSFYKKIATPQIADTFATREFKNIGDMFNRLFIVYKDILDLSRATTLFNTGAILTGYPDFFVKSPIYLDSLSKSIHLLDTSLNNKYPFPLIINK
jgi:hypothetical protein